MHTLLKQGTVVPGSLETGIFAFCPFFSCETFGNKIFKCCYKQVLINANPCHQRLKLKKQYFIHKIDIEKKSPKQHNTNFFGAMLKDRVSSKLQTFMKCPFT